ncbi:M23 family metallopeptidase [Streptomyces sp. SAJ15]|uniref:M23 family metallopeptidase n=1 Tax=Streptomyces sp. SAJ15 TaxID=2011095 RepID=UPI0021B3466C|nr:M23 family metallopeptidase [Streptomyces sp. SAJ15]
MASNRSAFDEAPYSPSGVSGAPYGPGLLPGPGGAPTSAMAPARAVPSAVSAMASGPATAGAPTIAGPVAAPPHDAFGPEDEDGEEWNPTADSIAPVRGRHRVVKQRGGGMARSGAVLGVGVIAAVGAGGMATAKDRPNPPISMPDLGQVADEVQGVLPEARELSGAPRLVSDVVGPGADVASGPGAPAAAAPLSTAGLTAEDAANGATDAGEALRARIMQQAEHQQNAADDAQREAAARAAAEQAAKAAAAQAEADKAQKAAEAEAERKAEEAARKAEAEAERKAEAAAKAKAEAEAEAEAEADAGSESGSGGGSGTSAGAYALPVASYTLTSTFGQAGDLWSADHTGQDFAAPTGTPVKAVHGGTITSAGWAGAYGYRIVLTLADGTEIWYCHLSSMVKTSGTVSTGDVIGRVGATGNVTGPHLHLEVRPGGGSPVDPLAWLRQHGLNP